MPLYPARPTAARFDRAAGSVVVNGTAFVDVNSNLDVVLTMAAGQWAVLGFSGLWGNETTYGDLDVATIVSGSPVNYISGGTGQTTDRGIVAWGGENAVFTHVGSTLAYQAVAGDVTDGQVRFRLRAKSGVATNKTLYATAAVRLSFFGWVVS